MNIVSRFILGVCLSALLSGCGNGLPKIDDNKFLDSIGFNQPVTISVNFSNLPLDGQGNLTAGDNVALIALFAQHSDIKFVPNVSGPPWWNFSVKGPINNGQLIVPVASRVITNRSDQKAWSEGSINYYAETIEYDIKRIIQEEPTSFGASKLRLVLYNDPAVGEWRVFIAPERGTNFASQNTAEASQVRNALVNVGRTSIPTLFPKIQNARSLAFDQIEKSLADSGKLAKTSEANVFLSRNNKLLVYRGRTFVNQTTYSNVMSYCSELHAANAHWRLPTTEEIKHAALDFTMGDTQMLDTPDHRLWGDFSRPIFLIPTRNAKLSFSYGPNKILYNMDVYKVDNNNGLPFIHLSGYQMYGTSTDIASAVIEAGDGKTLYVDGTGNYPLKVICVACLAEKPEPAAPKPAIVVNQNPDAQNTTEMSLERLAAARTHDYWAMWSSPNTVALNTIEDFYGDTIKFYGKASPRGEVMKEKRKFAERWPNRKYEARDDSIAIKCDPVATVCNVTGIVDWEAASLLRSARATGAANFLFTFVLQGDRAKIVSESGSIVK